MPDDWAQTAADELLADLQERWVIGESFRQINTEIQEEIRLAWAEIIRQVARTDGPVS